MPCCLLGKESRRINGYTPKWSYLHGATSTQHSKLISQTLREKERKYNRNKNNVHFWNLKHLYSVFLTLKFILYLVVSLVVHLAMNPAGSTGILQSEGPHMVHVVGPQPHNWVAPNNVVVGNGTHSQGISMQHVHHIYGVVSIMPHGTQSQGISINTTKSDFTGSKYCL